MNQPVSGPFAQTNRRCDDQAGVSLQAAPVLVWYEPSEASQWLWFIPASTLIVILIIILAAAILIFLLLAWWRSRARLQTGPVPGPRTDDIRWQFAGLTDVGLRRELNEDSLLMTEAFMSDSTPYGLYVVADGLGGHQGGEIASQLTIDAIESYFTQQIPTAAVAIDEWLKAAAMAANRAVLSHQANQKQAKKMGSTVVMALVVNGKAHIANVGDSRAYHLGQETIRQVSVDHSLVERLIQIGQLTREEARTHKNRNVLYNSIGDKPEMEVNTYQIDLQPGDRVLLCSDGLSGMITDEEILNLSLSQSDPAQACQSMIEAAKSAGGTDNITAIIVQMESG